MFMFRESVCFSTIGLQKCNDVFNYENDFLISVAINDFFL